MRNLKLIYLLILIGVYSSCNNDDDTQTLSGIYTETSPVNGRSQLNFIGENIVIRSEPRNSTEDEFTYELINNIIKLTPNWNDSPTTEFEIEIINSSTFKIESMYPTIGINPITDMIFDK